MAARWLARVQQRRDHIPVHLGGVADRILPGARV
jgi:hypothetical protein